MKDEAGPDSRSVLCKQVDCFARVQGAKKWKSRWYREGASHPEGT
jgi:hypothetical protein